VKKIIMTVTENSGTDNWEKMYCKTLVKRETEILTKIPPHENIITLLDKAMIGNTVYIVTEYFPMHDLQDVFDREHSVRKFSETEAIHVTKQLASAVEFIHDMGIIHRDIKLANVVVSGRESTARSTLYSIKLIDFGSAKQISHELEVFTANRIGTLEYMAPEVYHEMDADKSADMWSIGVALYYLVRGQLLCDGKASVKSQKYIDRHLYKLGRLPAVRNALWDLVRIEPEERISARTLNMKLQQYSGSFANRTQYGLLTCCH